MIAILLTGVLLVIAAVHLLWALGIWWPIRDETALARAVVGAPGITNMPSALASSLVVVALLIAAWWPWYGDFAGRGFYQLGLSAIAIVVLMRGVAAYVPAIRRLAPEQPFARLDQWVYGPMCLIIGLGFLKLFLGTL